MQIKKLSVFVLMFTLHSCVNNHKTQISDGKFAQKRKFFLPIYELVFPAININTNSSYSYKVNKLNPQESFLGVKIVSTKSACINLKALKQSDTFLKMVLTNENGAIIMELGSKINNWTWSHSEFNPAMYRSSICTLYIRGKKFVPQKMGEYNLIVEISNSSLMNLEIIPIIKSTVSYSI